MHSIWHSLSSYLIASFELALIMKIFAGTLIERQPLYMKGLKQIPQYQNADRAQMKRGESPEWKGDRMLERKTEESQSKYRDSSKYYNRSRNYKMRKEASNS